MQKLRLAILTGFLFAGVAMLHAQNTLLVPSQYTTIQSAINAANPGDTVEVTDTSTYYESINFNQKAITVEATNGAIIDGSKTTAPAVYITGTSATGAILFGFTIQNAGKTDVIGQQGAIFIVGNSPTIKNNKLIGNFCAAIFSSSANPLITGNTITGTLATGCTAMEGLGSAIAISGNDPNSSAPLAQIIGNTITSNTASAQYASDKGGGAAINATAMNGISILRNILSNNVSAGYGGAFYLATTPQLYFFDNLVSGNKGISGGLDIVVPGKTVGPILGYLANNTIAYNTATSKNAGSDVYIGGNLAQYVLVNNIIVGNVSGAAAVNCGTAYSDQTLTPLVIDHNDLYSVAGSGSTPIGGACTTPDPRLGNISQDPLFLSATDFHIQNTTSPVIDAGNNSGELPALGQLDLDGHQRVVDAGRFSYGYPVIDMGAYEFAGQQDSTITSVLLTPSSYTPATGDPVKLTAQVSSSGAPSTPLLTPNGLVTFYEDYASIGTGAIDSNGTATFTIPSITSGLHYLQAVYTAQNGFPPATSIEVTISATVGIPHATTTTITSSASPSVVGQNVTFSANVATTGGLVPTGSVTFTSDMTTLASGVPLDANGNASTSTSALAVSATGHIITAAYVPTGNFSTSSGSLTQIVNGFDTGTYLAVSPTGTAAYGSKVTLKATVNPSGRNGFSPDGTVSFYDGGTPLATISLTSDPVTYSTTTLAGGQHNLTCIYNGDANFNSSSCNTVPYTVTLQPTSLTLTSTANPGPSLTPIPFSAQLLSGTTPVVGATVTVYLGTAAMCTSSGSCNIACTATTNAQGTAACSTAAGFYPGTYAFTGLYSGDASHGSSNEAPANITVVPNPTTITLIAAPNPAPQGLPVTLSVAVLATIGAAAPQGTITVFDGTTSLGTYTLPLTQGTLATISFSISTLSLGDHTLSATYAPLLPTGYPAAFLPSQTTASTTVTITPQSFNLTTSVPSITIQSGHNNTLTVTASTVGTFNGTVQLACAAPLPPVLSCTFQQPQLALAGNNSASTTLKLETDAVPNFYGSLYSRNGTIAFATLLPLALLGLLRRRSRARSLLAVAVLATATLASGCSSKYPAQTPPGTYDIVVTGSGTPTSLTVTKSVHLQLVVTP